MNKVSPEEIEARIRALCEQRNDAQDKVAVLVGKLTVEMNKVEQLEAKLKGLETKEEPKAE